MTAAELIIALSGWWLILGALVSAAFLLFGIDRIDEDAQGAYVFRPLLIPAILLIWPLVLWRWFRLESQTSDWLKRYQPPRATHMPAALILAAGLAFAVVAGIAVRQEWPAEVAPQQLSEPGQ